MTQLADCVIVGGGVIGLSLAYELARNGVRVRVVERGLPGREASWAGAGILPPVGPAGGNHPYQQLARLSHELHPGWARQLREETGIDNGYLRSGAIYLAEPGGESALREAVRDWHEEGLATEVLDNRCLIELEPELTTAADGRLACWLPDEAQIRNPRHLKALAAACRLLGVEIESGLAVEDFDVQAGRAVALRTASGRLVAGQFCIATGAWTRTLLSRIGFEPAVKPVRGQIVLLSGGCGLRRIVNEGSRYLVPRGDGRVLVGSTEEDAGFDKRTTAEAVGSLIRFALDLVPALGGAQLEQCWAGLRPGTLDGLPYLGRVPGLDNAFVAAGHFRSGLRLSCATAVVMGRLMRGEPPGIDLAPFRLDRG
ncbi:MAG: glycine oxidase ThiO [Pirellulales bacterium]